MLLSRYDELLQAVRLQLLVVSRAAIDRATELRAKCGLKVVPLRRSAPEDAPDAAVGLGEIGAVPVTSVLRTICDCVAAHVSPEFIDAAVRQARDRGIISNADLKVIRPRARCCSQHTNAPGSPRRFARCSRT